MGRKDVIWLDEKTKSKDISGKVYIVTGANSGVGLETARQLVKQGSHVIMACRRTDAAADVAKSFSGLKGSYEVMRLDLADLQSVRDFATEFLKKHNRLDGLACNAGSLRCRELVFRSSHIYCFRFRISSSLKPVTSRTNSSDDPFASMLRAVSFLPSCIPSFLPCSMPSCLPCSIPS